MRRSITCISILLTLLAGNSFVYSADNFENRIDGAIEKGVDYLRSQIEKEPWSRTKKDKYVMGRPAIEVYALLKSDVSVHDPLIQKTLLYLEKLPPRHTYGVALYIMMLDAALGQMESNMAIIRGKTTAKAPVSGPLANRLLNRMVEMTRWLIETRRKGRGVWDYPSGNANRYDHSNTQFAILGLGVAAKRGYRIPLELWGNIADHFLATQQKKGPKVNLNLTFTDPEGMHQGKTRVVKRDDMREKPPEIHARGWAYIEPNKGVRLTMTAAGLSSLILAREYLFKSSRYPADKKQKINQAIWDGSAWLARNGLKYEGWFYYGLYSVEKVGDLGMMEKIGKIDWYRHGAEIILKNQKKNGSWDKKQSHDHKSRYQTSLALLFLNRATDLIAHSRPLLTGRGSGPQENRDGWIYVKRLRAQVSARRFFRKIRFNPDKRMHRLVVDMVDDAIALGKAHELISHLISLHNSPYKSVQELSKDSLQRITGKDYANIKQYGSWTEKWRFIEEAASKRDKKAIPKLREFFRETESASMKKKLIWAFEKIRALEPVKELLDLLESGTQEERARAYSAIKFITNKRLPFSPSASVTVRKSQVVKWRSWLEKQL